MTSIVSKSDTTINALTEWGRAQSDIRAMLLTSTRAVADAPTDRYSDYDVVLITTDVAGRHADHSWQEAFGEIVIAYHDPLEPDAGSGVPVSGSIVYYPGTLKIDFTIWPTQHAEWLASLHRLPAELDAGYRVLLDKDAVTALWPAATGVGYQRSLPEAAGYLQLVNDFFIGVPYVITALMRGELLPAKWVLDYDMRYEYLLPMLEWHALVHHKAPIIGSHGKGLHRYLPQDMWQQLEHTFAGSDSAANREALHAMIALFREAAITVGEAIGTPYPQPLHDRILVHIRALEAGE